MNAERVPLAKDKMMFCSEAHQDFYLIEGKLHARNGTI